MARRVMGVDVGARRVGIAISDATGTLARPVATIEVKGRRDAVERLAGEIARFAAEDDGLATVVIGMPVRLDGSPNEQTAAVASDIADLKGRTPVPIVTEDERLTSVEAESRLATRERDWRVRKAKLDAAAAAVILQDYLDRTNA